jgi:hypothetical protein
MGPGYTDDIFYSLKNGEISKAARDTWDIAFFTPRFSAGIIINESNGVELYTYPNGDTSSWANIDTSGMSGWKLLQNDPEYWEEGAFNRNALGHPDYGWGVYNMVDHSVYGDSLYIVKSPNGWTKKLWIQKKVSINNIYIFRFSNLDGSDNQYVEFDVSPYETKNFVYYSLEENEPYDREPEKSSWDLQFTKYIDMVPTNEGDLEPYLVTGATNNVESFSNNFYPELPTFVDWAAKPFDSTKNAIGYDWKSFDMGLFQWTIKDSNYYFVNTVDGDIYRLQFKSWDGSMSGDFVFDKWLVSLSSVNENELTSNIISIYPNPAHSDFTIKVTDLESNDNQLMIMDQAGRMIFNETYSNSNLLSGIELSNLNLSKGLYLVTIKNKHQTITKKLIIN